MTQSSAVRLLDRSNVAEARRIATDHAALCGFDEAERSNVAIIATELATNLLRHARDGVLAVTGFEPAQMVSIAAVDRGPGIPDLAKSFSDGYSSAGSSGTGLGAVSRLATRVDVYSTAAGTVLVAEVVRAKASAAPAPRVGAFALPKEGQQANGDAWSCRRFDAGIAVLACDGLGHGAFASDASSQAVAAFQQAEWRGPKEMVEVLHQALRPTRGAAAAVAFIETAAERLRYAGIGNISGCIVSGEATRHLVSQNGILGHSASRISEFEYTFTPRCTLVMHSDGISARWQPLDLGMVWERHPALLAGLLYRDFSRGNDDVVAVVINP